MNKKDILKKLLNKKIIKISKGSSGYFKLDNELNIYSYACNFNVGKEFQKRDDFTIDSLMEHITSLQNEGFTLEFLNEKDFNGED